MAVPRRGTDGTMPTAGHAGRSQDRQWGHPGTRGWQGSVSGWLLSPSGVCESQGWLEWFSVRAENVSDRTKSLCEFAGPNLQFISTPGLALTASFSVFQDLPALLCSTRSAGNRPQQFPSPHA